MDALMTLTVNVWVVLRGGEPLSVTLIASGILPAPCGDGQVNKPETGSRLAPAGAAPAKLWLKVWAGLSTSMPTALTTREAPTLMVLLPIGARPGGVFTIKTAG